VLKKLQNKVPGIENITGEMMKADKWTSTKWLKIFNKIWAEGRDFKRMVQWDINNDTEEG
jgi:hypothetical protein